MTPHASGKKISGKPWTCHDADGNEIPTCSTCIDYRGPCGSSNPLGFCRDHSAMRQPPSYAMESACEYCKDTGHGCSCDSDACEVRGLDDDLEVRR